MATAKVQFVDSLPPRSTGAGGGNGPAEDIVAIVKVLLENRDKVALVAPQVHNPNRFYEALRGEGAQVSSRRNGEKTVLGVVRATYDVYAWIPTGEVVPHHKPSMTKAVAVTA